jgi:response regulator of citrate/malate metabolism
MKKVSSSRFENWTQKPSESTSDSNFTDVTSRALSTSHEVRDVIDGNRRLTVREVADKCAISKTTVYETLVQELHMNRICARWRREHYQRQSISFN